MISKFPIFSSLRAEHRKEIELLVNRFPPYSDFNFNSLFSWNVQDNAEVSLLNGNLVVRMSDYLTSEPIISIIGDRRIDESINELFEITDKLKLVPHDTVKRLKKKAAYDIEEDRDNHDYIYGLADIVNLRGETYKKIRNKLNAFSRSLNSTVNIKNSPVLSAKERQEFIIFFDHWSKATKQDAAEYATEKKAILRILESPKTASLSFLSIKLDSELVAFSINETLNNEYALCHFEKALSSVKDLYVFIAYETSKALLDLGMMYANWEQDLGIEGLRAAKLKWHPAFFLKKYTIVPKK